MHAVGSPVFAAVFPESGSVPSPEVYGGCRLRLELGNSRGVHLRLDEHVSGSQVLREGTLWAGDVGSLCTVFELSVNLK